jgi:hypothetical protein
VDANPDAGMRGRPVPDAWSDLLHMRTVAQSARRRGSATPSYSGGRGATMLS